MLNTDVKKIGGEKKLQPGAGGEMIRGEINEAPLWLKARLKVQPVGSVQATERPYNRPALHLLHVSDSSNVRESKILPHQKPLKCCTYRHDLNSGFCSGSDDRMIYKAPLYLLFSPNNSTQDFSSYVFTVSMIPWNVAASLGNWNYFQHKKKEKKNAPSQQV